MSLCELDPAELVTLKQILLCQMFELAVKPPAVLERPLNVHDSKSADDHLKCSRAKTSDVTNRAPWLAGRVGMWTRAAAQCVPTQKVRGVDKHGHTDTH